MFYAEMEQLLLSFFRMPATLWSSITTSLIKITTVTAQKTKTPKTRASMPTTPTVHNDLNDNNGRVRCRELLTRNLRNFVQSSITPKRKQTKKCRVVFMSINLAKAMETVEQNPLCCVLGYLRRSALHQQLSGL